MTSSGWHGHHNYDCERRGETARWRSTFHYAGEDASFLRVVDFEPHLHLNIFMERDAGTTIEMEQVVRTWWGFHADRRWCYIVDLGVQPSDTVAAALAGEPPPTPSPRSENGVFEMFLAAELGLSPIM